MPAVLLRRACEVSPVDLAVPRTIARDYEVSILASTIRFAELASERCAAVFCAARQGQVGRAEPDVHVRDRVAGVALDRALARMGLLRARRHSR